MKAKFKGKMTIQMKAQLRKSLKQIQEESVQDFYNRCKEAEKLICDEQIHDAAFERDCLLTFLIGLREELQLRVMQSEGSSLSDFLQAAIKVENNEDEPTKVKSEFFGDEDDDNVQDDLDDLLSGKGLLSTKNCASLKICFI